MKTKIIILLISSFVGLGTLATPHEKTTEFKIAQLCNAHQDKDCLDIDNYCRESLARGHECYIIE